MIRPRSIHDHTPIDVPPFEWEQIDDALRKAMNDNDALLSRAYPSAPERVVRHIADQLTLAGWRVMLRPIDDGGHELLIDVASSRLATRASDG